MKRKKSKLQYEKSNSLNKGKELIPLNQELYTEFSIEELEQRLETKAWGCESDCGSYTLCAENSCNGYLNLA